ncbi:alpha/beta fold hydrolase [Sphingomonas sp. PB1R3]|uniref:alpha/beta fold hydrolase n=1 Tax=Sphingomonas flavida TaxID=3096154 RepID=UPI002FC703C6
MSSGDRSGVACVSRAATAPRRPANAAVRVPTLVAGGERDRICVPTDARALSVRIAGARFH